MEIDFNSPQGRIIIAVIVLVVIGLGYFMWTKTAPPTPRLGPGQSLENPFGTQAPGGMPPGGGPPGGMPPGAAPGGQMPMGPSPNAPIPGRR
jgi:hypothetical protein